MICYKTFSREDSLAEHQKIHNHKNAVFDTSFLNSTVMAIPVDEELAGTTEFNIQTRIEGQEEEIADKTLPLSKKNTAAENEKVFVSENDI